MTTSWTPLRVPRCVVQTCRCVAKSSMASGGSCDGRWHVIDVYEHGWNWDRLIEWWQWVGTMLYSGSSLVLSASTNSYELVLMWCGYCLSSIPSTCLLLCFLKAGRTPVMLAAGKGHTGVVDMLVHKYNCSLTEIDKVSTFDVLWCQSPVGVRCHKCTSASLPSCQCVDCHSACSQHLFRYINCTISSPDSALHTALAHVINVLGIIETPLYQCCNHMSDCSVQCAIGTRNREMTVHVWQTFCVEWSGVEEPMDFVALFSVFQCGLCAHIKYNNASCWSWL